MSFPFNAEELEGSPTIEIGFDNTSATRIFRVPNWSDWPAFAGLLIGRYDSTGSLVTITPGIPFPGMPFLFVDRLLIEPFDPANPDGGNASLGFGTNEYPMAGAKLTASYRSRFNDEDSGNLRPTVPDGTFLEIDGDIGAEKVTFPGRQVSDSSDPSKRFEDDTLLHQLVPLEELNMTWHYVRRPPWNAMRSLRGKVNGAMTPSSWAPGGKFLGFEHEQVLYLGSTYNREFQFGERTGFWKIKHRFAIKQTFRNDGSPCGWNHVPRRDGTTTDFHRVTLADGVDKPPYRTGDFEPLFGYE
jgi:hypothetical protein